MQPAGSLNKHVSNPFSAPQCVTARLADLLKRLAHADVLAYKRLFEVRARKMRAQLPLFEGFDRVLKVRYIGRPQRRGGRHGGRRGSRRHRAGSGKRGGVAAPRAAPAVGE